GGRNVAHKLLKRGTAVLAHTRCQLPILHPPKCPDHDRKLRNREEGERHFRSLVVEAVRLAHRCKKHPIDGGWGRAGKRFPILPCLWDTEGSDGDRDEQPDHAHASGSLRSFRMRVFSSAAACLTPAQTIAPFCFRNCESSVEAMLPPTIRSLASMSLDSIRRRTSSRSCGCSPSSRKP